MFLAENKKYVKELKNRINQHKFLVIKSALIAFFETIYDDIEVLQKYRCNNLTAEEKADYVIYTLSKKELEKLYEICWEKVGTYLD